MGKSMFLRKVQASVRSVPLDRPRAIVIAAYLDTLAFGASLNAAGIYIDIIKQVEEELFRLGALPSDCPSTVHAFARYMNEENRAFRAALLELLGRSSFPFRVVVLIDEIQPVLRSPWGRGFCDNLRQLLTNEPDISSYLDVVIAGAKEMVEIAVDIGSPLANVLSWKHLELFSYSETSALVSKCRRNINYSYMIGYLS